MAALVKVKEWDITPNIVPASNTSPARMWTVLNALVTLPVKPHAVAGSSDGVTGAMDAVNRLDSYGDWLFSAVDGAPHGWLVTTDENGCQTLYDYWSASNNENYCNVSISPSGGFTGGDESNAPTAPDQYPDAAYRERTILSPLGSDAMFHIWRASDGSFTYVVSTYGALGSTADVASFWAFGVPTEAASYWTRPYVAQFRGGTNSVIDAHTAAEATTNPWEVATQILVERPEGGGAWAIGQYATEIENGALAFEQTTAVNVINSEVPAEPVYVCTARRDWADVLGRFPDLFTGGSGAHAGGPSTVKTGDVYPGSGDPEWIVMGAWALPWDADQPALETS